MGARAVCAWVVAMSLLACPSAMSAPRFLNPDGSRATRYTSWALASKTALPIDGVFITVREDSPEVVDAACMADAMACVLPGPADCATALSWSDPCLYRRSRPVIETESPVAPFYAAWRYAFRHELGHVFDASTMTDGYRSRFAEIRGLSRDSGWRDVVPGQGPLQEVFAEAYANCATLGIVREDRRRIIRGDSYGYVATTRQHNRSCSLIVAARRNAVAAGVTNLLPVG